LKKYILIFIFFSYVTGIVSAGGGAEEVVTNEIIVLDALVYGNELNVEGSDWIRIVKTFETLNPNIRIEYEMYNEEEYHNRVIERLTSGNIPDIAYMGADERWGRPWKEAGQQFDHREYLDTSFYDMNLIPSMGPDGEIYEIPLGTSNITTVLYMNEDLVNTLGFFIPKDYNDIVSMVPAARSIGLNVITIDGADSWAWSSCLLSVIIARLSGDPQWVSKAVRGEYSFTDEVFINSLEFIKQMINDGVIAESTLLIDYDTNIANYNDGKALFMIQGQWAAADLDPEIADKTIMLALPEIPGEKSSTAGSVAAAIQTGYGLTADGAENPDVRNAALQFLQYYYSARETTQRLREGGIIAPILKDYRPPDNLPSIIKQKVVLARKSLNTDVIDAYLSGEANEVLNTGCQKIVAGISSPYEIAEQIEKLLER
jgi:raffinose/stachyose/melibiose transport system substrate-binding protein